MEGRKLSSEFVAPVARAVWNFKNKNAFMSVAVDEIGQLPAPIGEKDKFLKKHSLSLLHSSLTGTPFAYMSKYLMKLLWISGLAALFISMPQAFAKKGKACDDILSDIKVSKKVRSAILDKMNVKDGYVFTKKDIKKLVVLEKTSSNMRVYFVDQEKIGTLINIQFDSNEKVEKVIIEEMLGSALSKEAFDRVSDPSYIPFHILDPMLNIIGFGPKDIQDIEVLYRSPTQMTIYVQHTSGGAFTVDVKTDYLSEVKKINLEYQKPELGGNQSKVRLSPANKY